MQRKSTQRSGSFYIAILLAAIAILLIVLLVRSCGKDESDPGQGTPEPASGTPSGETTPAAPTPDPTPTPRKEPEYKYQRYHIEVSVKAQIVYIYDLDEKGNKNNLVKTMICSTAREGYETPLQKWVLLDNDIHWDARHVWKWLNGNIYGHYATRMYKVTGDGKDDYERTGYLFHSVPYQYEGKNDSLFWDKWNLLGQPGSEGCIRLMVADSLWIYTYCAPYTYVYTMEGEEDPDLWNDLKPSPLEEGTKYDPTDPERPDGPLEVTPRAPIYITPKP